MRSTLALLIFGVVITLVRCQGFIFDYDGPIFRPSQNIPKPNRPINNDYSASYDDDYNTGDDYNSFLNPQPNRPNGNRPTRPPIIIQPSTQPPPPSTTASRCEARCVVTGQYNPVCGTDNMTYNNIGRLECAQRCGKNIQLRKQGRCAPLLPGLQQIRRFND